MKRCILFVILSIMILEEKNFAQDIITLKNGDELKVKILEVLPEVVKYKRWENQSGPLYTENKSFIFMIKYENGTKDVFNQQSNLSQKSAPVISDEEARKSAVSRIVEDYFYNGFTTMKNPNIILANYRKTNGISKNVYGQSYYIVQYELTLQFVNDAWLKGNSVEGYWNTRFSTYRTKPDLYKSGEQLMYSLIFCPRGSTYIVGGSVTLANTDNGYKIESNDIETSKNLGIRPLQAQYSLNSTTQSVNAEASKNETVQPNSGKLVNPTEINYQSFTGSIKSEEKTYIFQLKKVDISAYDLISKSYISNKILECLPAIKSISQSIPNSYDSLWLECSVDVSLSSVKLTGPISYFAKANFGFKLIDRFNNIVYQTNYQKSSSSNYGSGLPSQKDAIVDVIDKNMLSLLSQFFIGNFPVRASILDVTETNRRKDEAKYVKIDVGRNVGVFIGFEFIIAGLNQNFKKGDLEATEVYDTYSICRVLAFNKEIYDSIKSGKVLKIQTKYRAELQ